MMEIPNLGKYCCEINCNQLDFLPVTCKCGKVFCSNHFSKHCLICQVCGFQNEAALDKDTTADYVCSKELCKERSYVPLLCTVCNKHYCVLHRHVTGCSEENAETKAKQLEKFNAPLREFNEVKLGVDKKMDALLIEARKKPKTAKMANKVQLMRIKSKAIGLSSIPITDRVYFNILNPGKSDKLTPIFISKSWTLGKAIDAIANECNVINRNNQSSALKLRLFHKDTGKIISSHVSATINSLMLEDDLLDGEDLILEYVDDNCMFINVP